MPILAGMRGRSCVLSWLGMLGVILWLAPCGAAVYTVTTTADTGAGSLRQALVNVNNSSGLQNINFQLTTRPYTINLASALPAVLTPVVIDGTTQPGYTNKPIVELNGTNAAGAVGLNLVVDGCTIRGLVLNRFASNAIEVSGNSNLIAGNWIGTDTNGLAIQANHLYGIHITSAGNLIGGTNAADRNVICGNDTGIYLDTASGGNVIRGNWIGVNASNSLALGNFNNGILVTNSAGNRIGGTNAGEANVISGNKANGIYLGAATGNVVMGNYIGTDSSGGVTVSNYFSGVVVDGSPGNIVGPGNLVSGNGIMGVSVVGVTAISNVMVGNFVGSDKTGRFPLPNLVGVSVAFGRANLIGGTNAGSGNLISGNAFSGVQLVNGTWGNWVQGNLIGVNVAGTNALLNGLHGVVISTANSNNIGGTVSGARNIISGNSSDGVHIQLVNDTGNVVQGNYIGTDITGMKAIANGGAGVLLQGSTNLIGGLAAGAGNLISGNLDDGINITPSSGNPVGNIVQGNIIGLDVNGVNNLPNASVGISIIIAYNNLIGGPTAAARNVISGNGDAGIIIYGLMLRGNVVQGNYIGTDITGRLARGNTLEGIYIQDSGSNLIGGTNLGAGNLISANHTRGISLTNSPWNTIQGNFIGTDVTGTNNLGNTFAAIELMVRANTNSVGGTNVLAANRIAFSQTTFAGIRIRDGATNNLISGNSIFGNGGLGIDLGTFGPWVNVDCESGVAAGAANAGQNYPVVTNVVTSAAGTLIRGYLDSAAGKTYQLQFFANPTNDPTGYGEGQQFLGASTLTLGSSCSSNFTALFPTPIPVGWTVAATATSPANNTSEFSFGVPAVNPPVAQIGWSGQYQYTVLIKGTIKTLMGYSNSVVSYTNLSGPFRLQQTFSLAPPLTWSTVTNATIMSGGNYSVATPIRTTNVFFRLVAP